MADIPTIHHHEGKKYLRKVHAAVPNPADPRGEPESVWADVYSVIEGFHVDRLPHGAAHALKKILCAGERGKGDAEADLVGAIAALNRAVEVLRTRRLEEHAAAVKSMKDVGKATMVGVNNP